MADSDGKESQPSGRPSHPPPPCDPFTRYQTPWPRNEKDEQNPFVQFRRFADEQFQSFFSGIPKFFGIFSSSADSSIHQDVQQMTRRRHELEEGFRKHFEQDLEEQRQALKKLRQWHEQQIQQLPQEHQEAETPQSPWRSNGETAKCPALNEMRSDNARKCAAMFDEDGIPKTELDAYKVMQGAQVDEAGQNLFMTGNEALPDYAKQLMMLEEKKRKRMQSHTAALEDFEKVKTADDALKIKKILDEQFKEGMQSNNNWLSRLGWDGKQRQESMAPLNPPSKPSQNDGPTTTISRFASRWSSPFDNPHDTIPWLLVNPYSPVFLCNPDQPRVGHVKLQQVVNQPFRIVDTFYIPRGFFQFNDRREELAKKLPWADAFEDLVSLQQTGKMVDRDYSTYRTPKTWIHDMVNRGSLGPTWGFNGDGQLTKLLRESQDQKTETQAARQDDVIPGFFPPLPTPEDIISAGVVAAASNAEQELKQLEEDTMNGIATPSSQYTLPKEERIAASPSAPAQSSWSSTTWSSSTSGSEDERSDSIISSTTTTERWTRPDGTIETRRVFKRRFADGREIEEETHDFEEPKITERRHAVSLEQAPWPVGPKETSTMSHDKMSPLRRSDKQTQTATPVQDELKKEKRRGGGWFWN